MSQTQVFSSFNEQLACMADAGVPLEEGLRLIAAETRSSRARSAIKAVLQDLEQGQQLPQAFAKHPAAFPSMYDQVIDVGVKTGRMSHVLLAFSRHMAMVDRLKRQIWQAMAYPVVCLVVLLLVAIFLAMGPIPILGAMVKELDPYMSQPANQSSPAWHVSLLMLFAGAVPWICGGILLLLLLSPLVWWLMRRAGAAPWFTDTVLSRVPLLGPALRAGAVARWCNVLAICTEAGLDLPTSIELSAKMVALPSVSADSADLVQSLRSGMTLRAEGSTHWRRITPATRVALQLGAERQELPHVARTVAELNEREAQQKAAVLAATVSPIMLLLIAVMVTGVLGALMLPITRLLRSFM